MFTQKTIQVSYLEIFSQENWQKYIPKKFLINSHTFYFDHEDAIFFINDCTNPDYSKLKINSQINQVIKQKLNGQAFLKIYDRTPKDIQNTMTKILNTQDLTMAIKMSQFLTEAIDDEIEYQKKQQQVKVSQKIELKLTLRQYKTYLENPTRQFRLYFLNDSFVAMCQKVPNFISSGPTKEQIQKAKQIGKVVFEAINKILIDLNLNNQKQQPIKIVVDSFILETGDKAKIFSIQPVHPLHPLTLFTAEQLKQAYEKAQNMIRQATPIRPLLKFVESPAQFKEVDLSHYRVGWELGQKEALQQWNQFIKGK